MLSWAGIIGLSFLILRFWPWPCSLHCIIQWRKDFEIDLAETVSEVSQESNVKFETENKAGQKLNNNPKQDTIFA